MSYKYFDQDYDNFLAHADVKSEDMKYGLPEKKAYPMPDRKHVMSAIKFFNYVSPKDEEKLAKAILARMEEYGISEVNVGPDNRFGKYYEKTTLKHYQIRGAKHGVRRWQNPDGSWTPAGRLKYGKGGAPRGSYKDNGKSLPKGRGHVSGADFDGDADTISIKNLKEDIKDSTKGVRYSFEIAKDLASKDSIKTIAKATQSAYEDLEAAGKKYKDLYAEGKHTDKDVAEYTKAQEAYQNVLKNVADKALGDLKDQKVRFAYDWDGQTYRDGEKTLGKMVESALQYANRENHKSIADISGSEFDAKSVGISVPKIKSLTEQQIEDSVFGKEHLPNSSEWPKNKAAASIRALMYNTEDLLKMVKSTGTDDSPDLLNLAASSEQQARKELTSVFIYDAKTREAMREAKEHGYMSLTEAQKDLLREVAFYDTPANRRLKRNQEKLNAAKEKQNSEKYQKNVEQKQDLERRLDKLRSKTNRIRDNKIFNDKDPNLIDRMRLNKERRLENKLSKVDKKISKVDNAVDKYQKKRDRMTESEKLKTARMVVDDMLEATNSKITKNSQAYRELVEDEMKYL